MSCNPVSSLASNTRSSQSANYLPSYFEVSKPFQSFLGKAFAVQIEQNWWQTASFSNSSSNLHTFCLPQFSRTLTLWAMYRLPINLLSRQSIPVPFRFCINLVQLTRSNAFCQSMKQTHSSASISKIHSDIILSIPTASLHPVPLLNPNWSSPSTSLVFLSILLLNIFGTIFVVCMIRLIVRWSLHFVACGFFFNPLTLELNPSEQRCLPEFFTGAFKF